MNMNFQRLRLQIHLRQLYDHLGAWDAESLIADAWHSEQRRHDRLLQQRRSKCHNPRESVAKHPDASGSDIV